MTGRLKANVKVTMRIGGRDVSLPMEMTRAELSKDESTATMSAEVPKRIAVVADFRTFPLRDVAAFAAAVEKASREDAEAQDAFRDADVVTFRPPSGRTAGTWIAETAGSEACWMVHEVIDRVHAVQKVVRYQASRPLAVLIARGMAKGTMTWAEADALAEVRFERTEGGVR